MINYATIENSLYSWAYGLTSIETIFAHQTGTFMRPSTQYILLNIVSITPRGIAESQADLLGDKTIDYSHSNVEEVFVSVNTFRDTALNLASTLKDSLARITVQEDFYAQGIGYSRATAVNDIPEVIEKDFEQRGQFDCFFFVRSLDIENINIIENVELTNELDGVTTIISKP